MQNDHRSIYHRVVALRDARRAFCICTVVDDKGSSPRKRGAKMLVFPDGSQEGTIGGGAIEYEVHLEALAALELGENKVITRHLTHELGMCCGGGMSVFLEVQTYPPRLYIFGGGHVGRPLADFAAACGFMVTCIDRRAAFADPARFDDRVRALHMEPLDALEGGELSFDEDGTFVVVVTHDHDLDEAIVGAVLERPFTYLGCIGSTRKAHKFRTRLMARGLSEAMVGRMRTPMGLDIKALLPEEIAISTIAEMIEVRRADHKKSEAR